jgi:hypothetical protein
MEGGRRHGVTAKTLKRMLKKAGLKTSGRKAALTRRAKKAGLRMKGGLGGEGVDSGKSAADMALDGPLEVEDEKTEGGRKRRRGSRKSSRGFPRIR